MKKRQIIILAILSLLAALVSLYTTSTGTGLNPDSYVYVASARSLLRGDGVRIPQGPDGSAYTAHFPPLYAAFLALSSLGIFDPVETVRWLNALLMGASLFLVSLSIWHLSARSFPAALLGGLLFLASAELLLIHAQVWSEVPFFFLMLLGLHLLSRYLAGTGRAPSAEPVQAASAPETVDPALSQKPINAASSPPSPKPIKPASPPPSQKPIESASSLPSQKSIEAASSPPFLSEANRPLLRSSFLPQEGWLLGAAAAIALACLFRYAGVMLIVTGGLSLLLYTGSPWRERLHRLTLFLAISAGPLGLWLLYNLLQAGSLTNRMLSRHIVDGRDFRVFLATVTAWLFPGAATTPWLEALTLAAILAGLAWLGSFLLRSLCLPADSTFRDFHLSLLRRLDRGRIGPRPGPTQPAQDPPSQPFAIFSLSYLAFLLVSLSLLDAQTSLDARILSPVYITILILGVSALARWLPGRRKETRWAALALLAAFTIAQLISGGRMAAGLYAGEDKGYTSAYWAGSRLLKQVSGLPGAIPIYSNGADVIYLLTGKPAIGLPREISPNSLKGNQNFEAEMAQMRRALEEDQAVLVVFYQLEERRRYLPSEWELNDLLPLKRVTRWKNEGALYRIEGSR